MIELKNIRKIYQMGDEKVHALRDLSLRIEDGDFVAIMGPSGSGKSTLAHILGLLDVPTSGSYEFNGREIAKFNEDELAVLRRDEIGFIFQQFNLLPRMNATENVALPLFYSKKISAHGSAQKLLERVGLGKRMFHRPKELSGGQQQRVAIARSLINQPKMILADEPTGNLDSASEKDIMGILKELNAQGITVIMVTHEEEIGEQAKRLIRMRDGVIQSDERREDLKVRHTPVSTPLRTSLSTQSSLKWDDVVEHFKQGFTTLLANKIRTALSMLGILIGVAAVVAMLGIGSGAQVAIETQLSALGSNLLVLRPGSKRVAGVSQEVGSSTRLSLEDALSLRENFPEIRAITPTVSGRVQAAFGARNWNSKVLGAWPSYASMRASVPKFGRFFSDDENTKRTRVAVIGATLVRELFESRNPIGEMIKINRISFLVIGVLPEKGSSGWQDQDDVILVPLNTAMHRLLGKRFADTIDVESVDGVDMGFMQDQLVEHMNDRHRIPDFQRNDSFQVQNMAEVQEAMSQSSKTMSALLASIAAISLLVGGIGIMNIMLVSVTERTKEIGLRKAIGARRRDILLQFLVESVAVSVLGGVVGILLGWFATVLLSWIAGWTTLISFSSVFLAFFFSVFIGVIFGIYPAQKASKLHPIDALRYE